MVEQYGLSRKELAVHLPTHILSRTLAQRFSTSMPMPSREIVICSARQMICRDVAERQDHLQLVIEHSLSKEAELSNRHIKHVTIESTTILATRVEMTGVDVEYHR